MKVKIGEKLYDSNKMPIMIVLNRKDKSNIAQMSAKNTMYCSYPSEGFTQKEIEDWMNEPGVEQ